MIVAAGGVVLVGLALVPAASLIAALVAAG